ncbi:hypothetical protein LNO09_12215 [Klebsiella variicola]|nr:hypothetical protein [Klebsiella variicola]
MTDITELAQSLKAAAIDAKELAIIARYSKGRAAAEKFYALANPNNVIALVEALELKEEQRANWSQMAQKLGENLDAAEKRIAELEETEQKLCAANTTLDARAELAERQLAEMESRTVKLPAERFCPAEYAGSQLWSETEVWNKAITACADALRASGIKVEAE